MQIEEILSRFGEVTEEADGGYLARCPSHGDTRPSLRIWIGENRKVRITCRAGCDSDDVVKAVGLGFRDLFNVTGDANTVPAAKPELVGTRHTAALARYLDESAAALASSAETAARARGYIAARFGLDADAVAELGIGVDGPEFSLTLPQRKTAFRKYPRVVVPLCNFDGVPHGLQGRDISGQCPGRWVGLSNPKGARWGAYGVLRGSGGYNTVIVTEGPGDGLTAAGTGYDAVVIRGAALAASPDLLKELADGLRGSMVVAAGDADAAGRRFNSSLAEGLRPYGIEVRALEISGSASDITAWREADPQGFPFAFHAAVKAASPVPDGMPDSPAGNPVVAGAGSVSVSSEQGVAAVDVLQSLTAKYGESDTLNAHALVAWTDGRIKFAPGLGFYVWNGRVWERSEVKVRQEVHRMGAALMLSGTEMGRRAAKGFTMRRGIDDLINELRSVPSVHVDAVAFDARPDLLSFANGTVDLRTGDLRPHDKADMLTYCLEVAYLPDAPCPRWVSFLEEIFPDHPELVSYMQRLIGYGITGSVAEQCFAVLYGKGANGKSVLTDTLTAVVRPVTTTTPFATFEEKSGGGIPNDVAALRGARLVMASEGESGKPMSEAVLKRVTGKDMIAARFLRQEFFEFKPTFLLMLATNHQPKFRGQDEGLWRRVKLIPFTRWFAPEERDHTLDQKLLAESEGIAAWAVRGAVEWYANGLGDPAVITESTRDYKETSDALAGFFSKDPNEPAILVADASARTNGADAFNAYLEWCEAENLPVAERWRRTTFYSAMHERGASKTKTAKGIALVGVRLVASRSTVGPGIFKKGENE